MIQLSHIAKRFGEQELFSDLNLKLNAGNKIGLVGRNGSGKSTLFKLILGEEHPDEGEVIIPKNYRIGALRQHLKFTQNSVREEAALALSEEHQYETYRVEKILFGLGFVQEDLDKDPLSFSGGYQIRINLAKLLVTEPNLLLLDEPTNYLDILSLRWLKGFLRAFQGEVILITHDRDFMDGITTHTMGLVRGGIEGVSGDTHKFYAQLKANDEHYEKQRLSQEKKRKELEEFIAKNKTRASTAAQAQSKVKLLEKMDQMDSLCFDKHLDFAFNFKPSPSKLVLEVKDLSFGYTPEKILFKDISFDLAQGECLAIIGKNGSGKSTLLNTIAGELTALSGSVHSHPSVSVGHFGQTNIDRLDMKQTVMEEIYSADPQLGEAAVRTICGAMMFSGSAADKQVSLLSGGEKSRVMLGQIVARPTNLLFLDEPTHHLDIDSIEALTKAIENFQGGSIIVSHSEELLRRVADRLIIFAKDGAEYFDGGYELFLEKIGWGEDQEEEIKGPAKEKAGNKFSKEAKKQRAALIQERSKKSSPLKKELEKLEKQIISLEEKLAEDHEALEEASASGDTSRVMELSSQIGKDEAEVEAKFERMEEAQMEYDSVMQEYEQKLSELE